MNELDEYMGNVYQKTNAELIDILKRQQEEQRMREEKNCILLTVICVILSVSVMFISFIGYLNNKNWLEVFNSYEYATVEYDQDGNGVNSINSGTMGDVANGSTISNQDCYEEKEK